MAIKLALKVARKPDRHQPENIELPPRAAHVYFTEACSDDLFKRLSGSHAAEMMKTLSEVAMSFVPVESQGGKSIAFF